MKRWRLMDLLELGDRIAVYQEIQTYTRLAEELRQPFYFWNATVLRALWALLTGQFEEGEKFIQEELILGQRAQTPNAPLLFAVQLFALRREQRRLQELEESVQVLVKRHPAIPSLRAGLAFLYSELGRTEDARSEFEQLATNQFADFPRDQQWFTGMTLLAQVAAFLEDTHHAAILYEILRPYAGRNVVVGSAADYYGSLSRYLGLLATTLGRRAEAAQHFEAALVRNRQMDARPLVAHTQYDYARLLVLPHQSCSPSSVSGQDHQKAHTLLNQAFQIAHEIGMKDLEAKIKQYRVKSQGTNNKE